MRTEHEEQRDFVQWFRRTFKGVRIFAIPNGGLRGKREAMRLKLEGVSSGVPDMFVREWDLWVEMKREKNGRLSATQAEWIKYLKGIGDEVIVANGSEDAKRQILTQRNLSD